MKNLVKIEVQKNNIVLFENIKKGEIFKFLNSYRDYYCVKVSDKNAFCFTENAFWDMNGHDKCSYVIAELKITDPEAK